MNRFAAGLLALGLLFASWASGYGQGDGAKPPAGADGGFIEEKLDADEPSGKDARDQAAMVRGSYPSAAPSAEALNSEEAKKTRAAMLKWLLYRLTWESVQAARESSISAVMEEALGGADNNPASKLFPPLRVRGKADDPDGEATRVRQREYVAAMAKQAVPELQKLLKNKELIVRVNAARVLERFAEWGREEVVETLIAIIENPKEHDAVRFWAIEALGHLLKDSAAAGNFGEKDRNGARYRKAALAVHNWLAARSAMPAEQAAQMTAEEKDGISYMRRHAVMALGNTQRPRLVEPPPGGGDPQGPVAELFVKIVDNSVSPPATWRERVETAKQLGRLQPRLSAGYQPDYVVNRLASFYAALGAEAAGDAARTTQRWRWFAAELKKGLDDLGSQAAGTPAQAYLDKVKNRLQTTLEYLDDAAKNPQAPQELFQWVGQNPSTNKSVFKQ